MSLLKKGKKKALKIRSGGGAAGQVSAQRPQQTLKQPPCTHHCPSGNDIRQWLTTIQLREKLGLSLDDAFDRAWQVEVETNPFPAIMGRVCPHPCEGECNRKEKDAAVAINSVERTIGDWGIERKLPLPKLDVGGPFKEKIAVIGAGPSGLSCAYQLARRGYSVTVFDDFPKPGGMLRWGIPEYRLPREIIDAEVQKIVELGVELNLNTRVGEHVTFDKLRETYDAIFVGIGAHQGKTLGVPGEDGPGVYTGTGFLRDVNSGEAPPTGNKVVVIGGGDTAIDAARVSLRLSSDAAAVSRRMGAEVTVLYRRTRTEMPAIEREIEEALEEGIRIDFLAAPAKILRDDEGKVRGMLVQKMELGEPDASGRRRPVPIEGDLYEIEVDTVITAVSQQPNMKALGGAVAEKGNWLEADEHGRTSIDGVWAGGDNVTLGLATISVGQGRAAAEDIHAKLRGEEAHRVDPLPMIKSDRIKLEWYKELARSERKILDPETRVAHPKQEVDEGITREQALEETNRCMSCGSCFACENCWMYCTPGCFTKVEQPKAGVYFNLRLETCDGCKKCAEQCPCGYLDMI